MEEKKNNMPYIVVIVLLILVICLLSYIAFFKDDKKTEKKDTDVKEIEKKKGEEKTEKENLAKLTDSELEDLADKIEVYNNGLARFYPLASITSLSNLNQLQFAISTIDNNGEISGSEVEKLTEEYFGKKATLADYVCDGETTESECDKTHALYEYDKDSGNYNPLEVNRGAYFIGVGDNLVKIESQEIDDDELVIKAKVVYGAYINSSTNPPLYYASLEDSKNDTNSIYEKGNWNEEISEEMKKELFNKVEDTTTYTFKKVGKDFILQSVE